MALQKEIALDNGVTVNYHRVVSVNTITNIQNTIEVASYTSEEKRLEEQKAIENGERMNIFIHTKFYSAPYDQSMTVEGAYEWIKENVSEFEGSEDI